ncbi:MAG: TrkH family potassium uptake protein [Firmicutes bacterium]|nr:TrkH family potassium uptake protein [Bacillota bacterium]
MNIKFVGNVIGRLLFMEGILLLPSTAISIMDGDGTFQSFFATISLLMIAAAGLYRITKDNESRRYYAQEGFITVGLAWVVLSAFGALPFWFSGQIPSYIDAFFETVSGFTTTGASILTNVEALSRSLLFWRSFTHWLGGMGILVFMLAIVPGGKDSGYSLHLMRAESPGPSVSKLTPRMKNTAMILYGLYFLLTALCFLFYILGGMPIFEAFCHAFGTAGTGGFGVLNSSMADYSPYIQWVTTIVMALFGVNFSVYFFILIKEYAAAFFDEELRLYWGVIFVSSTLITFNIRPLYDTLSESIRHAAFQVCTVMTTTGYATTDFDLWPSFSKTLLVLLMLLGASAGSTGGGLKMARVLLLIKTLRRNITQSLRPHSVQSVLINKYPMDEQIVQNTNAYLSAYCILTAAVILLISLDGHPFTTNATAAIACFNNIGPGLEMVGPTCNYSFFSPFSKLVLSMAMLLGRLEIFPILALFSKRAWNRAL